MDMAFEPRFRMGPPPGASPPMRMTASWFRSLWIDRIQVCGARSRLMASSPRTRLVVPLPVVCEPSPPGSGWPTGAGSQTTPNHRRTASKSALTENAPYKFKAVYAASRTMPNGSGRTRHIRSVTGHRADIRPSSIRHSLTIYSASRKASRRSFGRKRVGLPRSYGLSFFRAASLSARWACR